MKRTKTTSIQVRQGDVLLTLVALLPAGATIRKRDGDRVVLAYGEVTGHAHALAPSATSRDFRRAPAELYDADRQGTGPSGGTFLQVTAACAVVHEEHDPIALEPGVYQVTRQREWSDAEEPRQVAD